MRIPFKSLRALARDTQGSAVMIAAVGMVVMVAATGAAVDMSRAQMVQSRLSNSLDAAGLAAGSTISTTNADTVVDQYFYANYPQGYMGSTVTTPTVTVSTNQKTLDLRATATMPTTFLAIVGIHNLTLKAHSQITRANAGMELVLVMDNTGSMSQTAGGSLSKIQAAKNAASSLLDILYGSGTNTATNLWVGVVPFSQAVNIGTSHTSWLDATDFTSHDFGPTVSGTTCEAFSGTNGTYASGPKCTYALSGNNVLPSFHQENWGGCVESRSPGTTNPLYDITDDTPSTEPFKAYYWPDDSNDNWYTTSVASQQNCTGKGKNKVCTTAYTTTTIYTYSSGKGPNYDCPVTSVLPMVAEKSTVLSTINSMTAVGNTEINIGMAWAYRMLSPKWRGLWGGEMNSTGNSDFPQLPLAYHTALMSKVVILMTDGDNTITNGLYSSYEYPANNLLGTNECNDSSCSNAVNALNSRTTNSSKTGVCDLMKAQGIIIYTVALGTDISNTGKALLAACASNPSYAFVSPTTAALQTDFQQIGDSLANLRISQ